jgi:hypothetical protein
VESLLSKTPRTLKRVFPLDTGSGTFATREESFSFRVERNVTSVLDSRYTQAPNGMQNSARVFRRATPFTLRMRHSTLLRGCGKSETREELQPRFPRFEHRFGSRGIKLELYGAVLCVRARYYCPMLELGKLECFRSLYSVMLLNA